MKSAIPRHAVVIPCWIFSLGLALSAPLAATTYVLVDDSDLVDQASAVAEVRIEAREGSPAGGRPSTDYLVYIERLVKGSVPGSTLVVRVPGGVGPDGMGLHIFGAPRFEAGQRALLFLRPGPDGTFRPLHLMQGAFHQVEHRGRMLAVRDPGEAREVHLPGRELDGEEAQRRRGPRDLERFIDWIGDRERGLVRKPDYFVGLTEGELASIQERFTLLRGPTGHPLRWFAFDEGQTVPWRIHQDGQPGRTLQQVEEAILDGIGAWNGVPDTQIRYAYDGLTSATGGFDEPDGINAVLFGDPNGNIDGGGFSCAGGGTVAIGGPWFFPSTTILHNGELFHPIAEAEIVTNKGIGCLFNTSPDPQALITELLAHELGHTLGLDHSSESGFEPDPILRQAQMYFRLHDDGRGASLNSDDRAGARFLYERVQAPPEAPSGLTATNLSASAIRLAWTNNAEDASSLRVEMKTGGGGFVQIIGFLPASATTTDVGDLAAGTTYTFRVRARNDAGFSPYSNEASATTETAVPAAPSNLVAAPVTNNHQIQLTWQRNSTDELDFEVEMGTAAQGFQPVGVPGPGSESFTVAGLASNTPYTFRVRARNASGFSAFSAPASATTSGAGGPCTAGEETHCLLGGRFEVRVKWRNPFLAGDHGVGRMLTVPGSDTTGLVWFFDPDNVELIVKSLDGRGITGFFWQFYGALTNVEYWISVRDTETGASRTYYNPPGELCGLGDVVAFPGAAAAAGARPAAARTGTSSPVSGHLSGQISGELEVATAATGTCTPGPSTLCLMDDRFRVEVDWDNSDRIPGDTGVGMVPEGVGTDETGFFWFFSPDNLELAVKVLDGRPITGDFWVFFGALSDVAYSIEVTDTVLGNAKTFTNPFGNICGQADVNALPGS